MSSSSSSASFPSTSSDEDSLHITTLQSLIAHHKNQKTTILALQESLERSTTFSDPQKENSSTPEPIQQLQTGIEEISATISLMIEQLLCIENDLLAISLFSDPTYIAKEDSAVVLQQLIVRIGNEIASLIETPGSESRLSFLSNKLIFYDSVQSLSCEDINGNDGDDEDELTDSTCVVSRPNVFDNPPFIFSRK